MEISLVRSAMNVQRSSNVERRDTIQSNRVHSTRPRRHTSRGQLRGGHRISRHHDIHNLICDELDHSQEVNSAWRADFAANAELLHHNPCDGYLQASSQLQLFPGQLKCGMINNMETVPWDSVAQIMCIVDATVCCPICLYPPIAPRMERCGHVYCGPCVAQYVHYDNDRSSKKCAVCSWILRLEDMKRVCIISVSPLKVGLKLPMVLVRHPPSDRSSISNKAPEIFDPTFSFVVELQKEQLRNAVEEEISALNVLKLTCIEDGNVELLPEISCMTNHLEHSLKDQSFWVHDKSSQLKSCDSSNDIEVPCSFDVLNTVVDENSKNSVYQAKDGQLIFLDGLMWKCLLAEYGSVTNLPEFIEVTVAASKAYKMTQALRRRWRHLKHVPLGHTFHLVEIELDDLVGQATLDKFASALEARFIERDRNRLEDLRLTKLKEAAENRIPSLPEGFVITGHVPLLGGTSKLIDFLSFGLGLDPADFVPLGASSSTVQQPKTTSPSFAEISRMGALSVVDQNRVANFARGPLTRRSIPSFNSTEDDWPTLSASRITGSSQSSSPRADVPLSQWRIPLTSPASVTGLQQQDTTVKSGSKKHRKRRTRSRSLHVPTFFDS